MNKDKKRRYMKNKTWLLILLFGLIASSSVAQKQKLRNLPYYDQRLLHWGFNLGLDMADMIITHSGDASGEGWWATCPNINPAFMVGLMGDVAITEHLNLRCSPSLHFQERKVSFRRDVDGITETRTQQVKSNYIEVPISLKISTRRINNYRPYLVTGIQGAFDLSHEKEAPLCMRRLDFGIHIGVGCDLYLPFFKLAPELRFNLGLLDMIDHERKSLKDETMMPFTNAISSARNSGLSLVFWFE